MSSKSKDKAEGLREDIGKDNSGGIGENPKKCPLKKHWIRIVVHDSDGKTVTDVKPTLEADGNTASVTLDKKGKYDTRKVLDSDAAAKITFPELVNCDWWPDGQDAPAPVGEKDLPAVAAGDCAERMAKTAGYRSYKDIWDAPENAGPKTDRPIPNSLLKTQVFKGPDKKDKSETKAIDAEWKFVVRAIKKPKLRIVVVDKELKAWKGVKWVLGGVATQKGTTGANGLIEALDIDANVIAGTLKLTPPAPDKQKKHPKAAKLPDTPPYPIPVNPEFFEEDDPVVKPLATETDYDLAIGSLPPHKDKTGTVARLCNIAYLTDDKADDEQLQRGVRAYQIEILKKKDPTGAFADIQDDIEIKHTKA